MFRNLRPERDTGPPAHRVASAVIFFIPFSFFRVRGQLSCAPLRRINMDPRKLSRLSLYVDRLGAKSMV